MRPLTRWMTQHYDTSAPVLQEAALTPREHDVTGLVAEGLEIKEIARELDIGYQTVKMHIARAKAKLGARNQLEIVILLHGGTPRSQRAAQPYICR